MSQGDPDVTARVQYGDNDGETLPLTRCLCGREYPSWTRVISIYRDSAQAMPCCGARLYFAVAVTVYQWVAPEGGPADATDARI